MTRLEIEAFLSVVKYGSISLASDKLFITQPALSRRIRFLEEELGYELFERGRGIRKIRITDQGMDFIPVAKRFLQLYQEAGEIPLKQTRPILHVSAVNSLAAYLLPQILSTMIRKENGCRIVFHSGRSRDIYDYVQNHLVDIALVSDVLHAEGVVTFPAFREPFVFAGGKKWAGTHTVTPKMLDPKDQIRFPWNPEYDVWHNKWFPPDSVASLTADNMAFLEAFLEEEKWVILPLLVARGIKRNDVWICPLENGPEPMTIYGLTAGSRHKAPAEEFLHLVHETVSGFDEIQSFLF